MLTKILLVTLYGVMCWPSMWHYCLVSPLNTPEFFTSFVNAKHRFVKVAHYPTSEFSNSVCIKF